MLAWEVRPPGPVATGPRVTTVPHPLGAADRALADLAGGAFAAAAVLLPGGPTAEDDEGAR